MEQTIPYLGESLALLTALVWAFAVILFKKSGETVHPIGLNLFKNLLAISLILPTMWLFGEKLNPSVPRGEYLLLLFSGALGIGVADTLFFKSLNLLGAGLSAIVDCLYSPFIIGLCILWLGESLTAMQVVGVVLIVSAVLTATSKKGSGMISRSDLLRGVVYGVLAMAIMALGIVMIKPLLNYSSLLWVTEIRLFGGVFILLLIVLFHPLRQRIISSIVSAPGRVYTVSGSFTGAYLAMILWLAGMKFTQASTASALNQTSNIFIFIFAAIFLREKINLLRVLGIGLAVSGVFLVISG